MDKVFSLKQNPYLIFFFKIVFYGTLLFWALGYLIGYFRIRDYGSWAVIIVPFHIFSTYIIMLPLTFVFTKIDKVFDTKSNDLKSKSFLTKFFSTLVYLFIILYFFLYKDYSKLKNDINYKADFNYFNLYAICLLFALTIGVVIKSIKNKYK